MNLPVRATSRSLPQVAVSPLSGLVAVGGGALGFVVGGVLGVTNLGGAVLFAVLAVVLRVAAARLAAGPALGTAGGVASRIDPFTVKEPWRRPVQDAISARNRFDAALEDVRPGPLRERLQEIGGRVGDGVEEVWRAANQGQQLAEARRRVPTTTTEQRHADVVARLEALGNDPLQADARADLERTGDALQAQLDSAARIDASIADATDRLRLQNARLDEAVARAVELTIRAGSSSGELLAGVASDIEHVVTDLEALRRGLEELDGPSPSGA